MDPHLEGPQGGSLDNIKGPQDQPTKGAGCHVIGHFPDRVAAVSIGEFVVKGY